MGVDERNFVVNNIVSENPLDYYFYYLLHSYLYCQLWKRNIRRRHQIYFVGLLSVNCLSLVLVCRCGNNDY